MTDYQKALKLSGFRLLGYKFEESDFIKGRFIFAVYAREKSRNPRKFFKEKFLEMEQGGKIIKLLICPVGIYTSQEEATRTSGWIMLS